MNYNNLSKIVLISGKSQDIIMNPKFNNKKIAILVAGNPGRPAGFLGKIDGSGLNSNYNKSFKTQEESIVAAWFQAEEFLSKKKK